MSLIIRTRLVWLGWSLVWLGTISLALASSTLGWHSLVTVFAWGAALLSFLVAPPSFVHLTRHVGRRGIKSKDRQALALARDVRLHLPYIADRVGVAVQTRGRAADGKPTVKVERPKLVAIHETPVGLTITLKMVLGKQTVHDFIQKAEQFASILGEQVTVVANVNRPSQWVDVTAVLWDPLKTVRSSAAPSGPHRPNGTTLSIGRAQDGQECEFDPYTLHTAVQGQTRSGKSAFAYGVLAGCAHDDSIVVAGCDPSGLLLAPFGSAPRPEWRATGTSDMEAHAAALALLVEEMDRRTALLLASGRDKFARDVISAEFPHVLIVFEEYAGLVSAATMHDRASGGKSTSKVSLAIELAVSRLLHEGAKCSMTVFTMLQRAEANVLTARAQYARRLSFRVDNLDSLSMLHPQASKDLLAQVQMFEPGMGLFEEPSRPVRVFRSDLTEYEAYRREVRDALKSRLIGDR